MEASPFAEEIMEMTKELKEMKKNGAPKDMIKELEAEIAEMKKEGRRM